MRFLSFMTLSALLTISACSHFSGKSCCAPKKSCCAKETKVCKDGSCDKKKIKQKECKDHCKKPQKAN
jgi:hypothetical protein